MRPALYPILLADPLPWAAKAPYAWDFLRDRARFAGGYKGALSNTPGWSYTRSDAQTAYAQTSAGVLTPFATGVLRRTDKGVLIEGARTNKNTNYNAVIPALVAMTATAATFNSGVTNAAASGGDAGTLWGVVDDSAAIAAAGLSAAVTNGRVFKIDNSAGSAAAYITFGGTTGNTNTHTFSAYMRGSGGIRYGDNGGFGATATVTADYVRYSHADATVGSGAAFAIEAGAGEVVYCILNQMEDASFVSSPIPIAGASATRATDVLTVPVSGIDYPLTVYVETDITQNADGVASQGLLAVSGAANNNLQIMRGPAPSLRSVVVATTTQVDTSAGSMSAFGTYKTALRVAANDSRHCLNGALQTADTSVTLPSAPTTIDFGNRGGGGSPLWSYIRKVAVWTRALTDSELQSVST